MTEPAELVLTYESFGSKLGRVGSSVTARQASSTQCPADRGAAGRESGGTPEGSAHRSPAVPAHVMSRAESERRMRKRAVAPLSPLCTAPSVQGSVSFVYSERCFPYGIIVLNLSLQYNRFQSKHFAVLHPFVLLCIHVLVNFRPSAPTYDILSTLLRKHQGVQRRLTHVKCFFVSQRHNIRSKSTYTRPRHLFSPTSYSVVRESRTQRHVDYRIS